MIKEEILNFYQNLYTENEAWRPNASFDDVAWISREESELLEKVSEEDEVRVVIQSCAPNKAPTPNEFTIVFYQKSCDFIKPEVMKYHQSFSPAMLYGQILQSLSFIAPIPKERR